tara:strand:+ start:2256 stop:2561 length:306 start_codon:yes stop_codon:yes gene_type:complete
MKITERRLRSLIRSVIKESHYSDDLSGGHMGPDPIQALGPRPDDSETADKETLLAMYRLNMQKADEIVDPKERFNKKLEFQLKYKQKLKDLGVTPAEMMSY